MTEVDPLSGAEEKKEEKEEETQECEEKEYEEDWDEDQEREWRKFVAVETILAEEGMKSMEQLQGMVKEHVPTLSSLSSFLLHRPQLFDVSMGTVKSRLPEQRRLFITVARHLKKDGPQSLVELDAYYEKTIKRWRSSVVRRLMERERALNEGMRNSGIENTGTFIFENGAIRLSDEAVQMKCLYSQKYYRYLVDDEPPMVNGKVQPRQNCGVTSAVTGLVVEVKRDYLKAGIPCGPYQGENVFCLPRQCGYEGEGTESFAVGDKLELLVHDVSYAAQRFRADFLWKVNERHGDPFKQRLAIGRLAPRRTPRQEEEVEVKDEKVEEKKDEIWESTALAGPESRVVKEEKCLPLMPISHIENEYCTEWSEVEALLVSTIDSIIKAGAASMKQLNKGDGIWYPLANFLRDLEVHITMSKGVFDDIFDSEEELMETIMERPHLYILEGDSVSINQNRNELRDLLRVIESRGHWRLSQLLQVLQDGAARSVRTNVTKHELTGSLMALQPLVAVQFARDLVAIQATEAANGMFILQHSQHDFIL